MRIHLFLQIKEAPYKRLCETKNILTVNGQFPGPTLRLRQGDTILVDVYNEADENITVHWYNIFSLVFVYSKAGKWFFYRSQAGCIMAKEFYLKVSNY